LFSVYSSVFHNEFFLKRNEGFFVLGVFRVNQNKEKIRWFPNRRASNHPAFTSNICELLCPDSLDTVETKVCGLNLPYQHRQNLIPTDLSASARHF
jgi:hypothetical protein